MYCNVQTSSYRYCSTVNYWKYIRWNAHLHNGIGDNDDNDDDDDDDDYDDDEEELFL